MIRKSGPKNNMSLDGFKLNEESKNQSPLLSLMRQIHTFKIPHKSPVNPKESGTSMNGLHGFSAHVLTALEGFKSA